MPSTKHTDDDPAIGQRMAQFRKELEERRSADVRKDPAPAHEQSRVEPQWGVTDNVPFMTYLQWDAFGSGAVREVGRSPAHHKFHFENGKDIASGRARMGSAVHACVLEPDTEWSRYHPLPDGIDRRHKEYKAAVIEFGADYVLRADEYRQALNIRDRLHEHSRIGRLLQQGRPEVSFAWTDEVHGVPLKGRADWISDLIPGGAVLDLKTTADARSHRFRRVATDFGYAVQGAHYTSGLMSWGEMVQHYAIIAVELTPPHEVTLYQISKADLMVAHEVWQAQVDLLAHCLESQAWPGYPEHTHVLTMGPYWQADMQARTDSIREFLKRQER